MVIKTKNKWEFGTTRSTGFGKINFDENGCSDVSNDIGKKLVDASISIYSDEYKPTQTKTHPPKEIKNDSSAQIEKLKNTHRALLAENKNLKARVLELKTELDALMSVESTTEETESTTEETESTTEESIVLVSDPESTVSQEVDYSQMTTEDLQEVLTEMNVSFGKITSPKRLSKLVKENLPK